MEKENIFSGNVTFQDIVTKRYFRVQRAWLMASYWSLDAPNAIGAQPEALSFLIVCRYILMPDFKSMLLKKYMQL